MTCFQECPSTNQASTYQVRSNNKVCRFEVDSNARSILYPAHRHGTFKIDMYVWSSRGSARPPVTVCRKFCGNAVGKRRIFVVYVEPPPPSSFGAAGTRPPPVPTATVWPVNSASPVSIFKTCPRVARGVPGANSRIPFSETRRRRGSANVLCLFFSVVTNDFPHSAKPRFGTPTFPYS